MAVSQGVSKESASTTQTFGFLNIDNRVLTTPARTISIRNIATVSVGTDLQPRSPAAIFLGILLLAAGLMMMSQAGVRGGDGGVALFSLLGGLILMGMYFRPEDKSHYLLISTSDGIVTRFTGPKRETLEEVRQILTEKINRNDESSTFNINFEKGTIENLNVAEAKSIAETMSVSGTGHAIATNGATAVSGHSNTVQTANGANGRVATADASYSANGSPGAQLGAYHRQNGAAHTYVEQSIDFSHYLPAVVDMHRFYVRQPNAEHVEKRLSELELLMRAGAPGTHQKSRVRELAGDLANFLQAYPPAVQIFQHIAALAGA